MAAEKSGGEEEEEAIKDGGGGGGGSSGGAGGGGRACSPAVSDALVVFGLMRAAMEKRLEPSGVGLPKRRDVDSPSPIRGLAGLLRGRNGGRF